MKKLIICTCALIMVSSSLKGQEPVREKLLDEVLVYSTRTAIPLKRVSGKIEVIDSKTIQRSGLRDLTSVLKQYSSVDVVQYPGFLSNIGIRGFAPDFSKSRYVAILINGVPSGTSNLSTIGLADIAHIEVLKGPFSSIYGTNAMGGVVNVITRKSTDRLSGSMSVSAGSYSSGGATLTLGGGITSKLSFDLGASYDAQGQSYTIGRKHLLGLSEVEEAVLDPSTRGEKMPLSNHAAFTGSLRVGYEFTPDWSLNVYENIFLGDGLPGGGSIWGVYSTSKKDLNRYLTSLELRGNIGRRHQLLFTPYYSVEKRSDYSSADEKAYVNYLGDTRFWGVTLQDEISLGGHKLIFGVDSRNTDYTTERFDATGQAISLYQPNYDVRNVGLFVQSNWQFLEDRLTVSAGARADFMRLRMHDDAALKSTATNESFNVLNPNVGVKYEILRGFLAHASFGTAFTAPESYQKAGRYETAYGITKGNADLKPERSRSFDVGVGYTNREMGLQLDLTYFNTLHDKMIVRASAGKEGNLTVTTYENANEARMSGLEAMVSYDFGSLANYKYSLRAYINATFMLKSRVLLKGQADWRDADAIRKQNITFGIDYKQRKLELGMDARFFGERQEQNWFGSYAQVRPNLSALANIAYPELSAQGRIRIPKALIFNANAHYDVTNQLRFGVNLNNLLDEHYMEKDGYHMPGRNVRFTAGYRF